MVEHHCRLLDQMNVQIGDESIRLRRVCRDRAVPKNGVNKSWDRGSPFVKVCCCEHTLQYFGFLLCWLSTVMLGGGGGGGGDGGGDYQVLVGNKRDQILLVCVLGFLLIVFCVCRRAQVTNGPQWIWGTRNISTACHPRNRYNA